jgi:hypothetical protein
MANRLAHSTSPYLLQHAANPVDWQEWGQEAFAEARTRDVPVLLSVGYAACHWCHVTFRWGGNGHFGQECVSAQVSDLQNLPRSARWSIPVTTRPRLATGLVCWP